MPKGKNAQYTFINTKYINEVVINNTNNIYTKNEKQKVNIQILRINIRLIQTRRSKKLTFFMNPF